jgi:hypothetical protein
LRDRLIEATYGWYWIVDWLHEQGATVHLSNPSGLNWGTRRVKNDERDATTAPPPTTEAAPGIRRTA